MCDTTFQSFIQDGSVQGENFRGSHSDPTNWSSYGGCLFPVTLMNFDICCTFRRLGRRPVEFINLAIERAMGPRNVRRA